MLTSRGVVILAAASLVLAGCSTVDSAPEPTPTGPPEVDVLELDVGDCIAVGASRSSPTVPLVDCELEHDGEAYASIPLEGAMFPGAEAVEQRAVAECTERFGEFIGIEYGASSLDFAYYFPTATSWERGDHAILCLAIDPGADGVSGSLAGAAR